MATVTVNDASLSAIAGAIREKLGVETTYRPSEMAGAIESIETGTDLTSADAGKVVVESSGEYILAAQTSRNISQNGTYDTTANNQVVVSVSGGGSAVYAFVTVYAENVGNVITLTNGSITLESDGTSPYVFAVPSAGTYTVATAYHQKQVEVTDYGSSQSVGICRAVRVYTKGVGGSDASMYVQNGTYSNGSFVAIGDPEIVIYTSVRNTAYDANGLAELGYPSSWVLTASVAVTNGTNDYQNGQQIAAWSYSTTSDITIWEA